jgi:hypothetical protein
MKNEEENINIEVDFESSDGDTKLKDKKGSNTLNASDTPLPSFSDTLYDKINSVIGGTNSNQFFCMTLPGTMIEKDQYSYDIEKNEPKPSFVEANESKLVNKLFDPCKMTGADNGRKLQLQYRSALDVLTPRLNNQLFKAKKDLRKALMTKIHNIEENGTKVDITLQDLFYRHYEKYVEAKRKWAEKQVNKKRELSAQYPENNQETYRKRKNEFIDWYETIAETEVLNIQEKLGKVLNVFSPNDMDIIIGILESGGGRELHEARVSLDNVSKLNPDGGYVYPVTLYPQNWFRLLDNDFNQIDLLESPEALQQKLTQLNGKKNLLIQKRITFISIIPDNTEIKEFKKLKEDAEDTLKAAEDSLKKIYSETTKEMLDNIISIMNSYKLDDPKKLDKNVFKRVFGTNINPEQIEKIIGSLTENASKILAAQDKVANASINASSASINYFSLHNKEQYRSMLESLDKDIENIDNEIKEVISRLDLAKQMQEINNAEKSVQPHSISDNFTDIIITSSVKSAMQSSSSTVSSTQTSGGLSFIFGGGYSKSTAEAAKTETMMKNSDVEINIGMSLAKVLIEREWFNPGLFMMTKDMYNVSSTLISPNPNKTFETFDDNRFKMMDECLFPCYPTAFVIAKNVTIRFNSKKGMDSSFATTIEEHSTKGGGFFCFRGSKTTSSKSEAHGSETSSDENSVTIRFKAPQIIGYYLEATPRDKSIKITDTDDSAEFISIFKFINDFQMMLDDLKKENEKLEI